MPILGNNDRIEVNQTGSIALNCWKQCIIKNIIVFISKNHFISKEKRLIYGIKKNNVKTLNLEKNHNCCLMINRK